MESEVVNERFDPAALTGPQLRAARAMLGISATELAKKSSVAVTTIGRAEGCPDLTTLTAANARLIVGELEAMGVTFLPDDGGGPGVRLKPRSTGGSIT